MERLRQPWPSTVARRPRHRVRRSGALQGRCWAPGGGLAAPPGGPPGSMQPNMMVAGPGVPGGPRGGAPPPMPPPGALGPPPGGGGGGNPLSALGNMFGLASPSSPQGGNSPAPARRTPAAKQTTQVSAIDGSSGPTPTLRLEPEQLAMQFMQYYVPHPTHLGGDARNE